MAAEPRPRPTRGLLAATAAAALVGCANLPPGTEAGASDAAQRAGLLEALRPRLGPVAGVLDPAEGGGPGGPPAALGLPEARVQALLAAPLDAEAAVELALRQHPGLQARLAGLGVAAAELREVLALPNPGFAFKRQAGGGALTVERGLHLDLARLLLRPLASALEARRFEAVQRELAAELLDHAFETRRAWVRAVAAEQAWHEAARVREATAAGAELARRLASAGNFSALEALREQAFHTEASLALARAERLRGASRERLVRRLGLWGAGAAALRLPATLPPLPPALPTLDALEAEGLRQRLDVEDAERRVEAQAEAVDAVRARRWLRAAELGGLREQARGEAAERGWELGVELPLLDRGEARLAAAEARLEQARRQAEAVAVEARSELREAAGLHRAAWELAGLALGELKPLREAILAESVLRHNGMLIGVFELLAEARAQVAAGQLALDAQRDFWLADADLAQARVGRPRLSLPGAPPPGPSAPGSPHAPH